MTIILLIKISAKKLLLHLHMQQSEISTILFQLKGSPQIIEDVLESVSEVTQHILAS